MTFVPYPEEEAQKSKLLLEAAVSRAQGLEEKAASLFAQAALLEEQLTARADADGEPQRAARSHFSAASAWANAGDFYHALELLQQLERRTDAPETLKVRAHAFAETVRAQRRQWQETLTTASLT